MTRRGSGNGDVPIVIREAGKAVERDIKPTLDLLGRIFLGGAPVPRKPERGSEHEPERGKPVPVRLPPSHQIVIRQVKREDRRAAAETGKEVIIDAEIIEDEEISRICPTCGGAGRLGRRGHEVLCPSCNSSCNPAR